MKITRLIFTILFIAAFIKTSIAQQIYPVNASGSLIPPFSLTLSDYGTTRTQDIIYNITLNDPVEPSRQVYFRLTIKHNGQEIYRTNPNYIGTPITLQQFSPQMITGSELADYLNPVNLVATGGNQITNRLPDGFNQICLEVIDFQRQVPISRQACIGGLFKQLQAPLLELPVCGGTANIGQTQNLMFRWLPRHLGQPNAPSSVQYVFTLVELPQGFTNAFDVFDKSLKIYETTSFTPTLFYTDTEPQLSEGKTYAWQVQAKDPAGSNVFDNKGKSPVCTFTVKRKTKTTVATNNIIPNCGAPITAYGPITYNAQKSELLAVGDAIKLGHFDMKITQINNSGSSYDGEGTVHIPFLKAHVKVDFQNLKIDPRKQAYQAGKIRAKYDVNMNIQESDLNPAGLRTKLNGNLRNQLRTLVAMPTAGGRKVSKRSTSDNTPIGLPLIMDRKDAQGNDLPAVVILDLQFSEKDAKLAAVALDKQGTTSLAAVGANVGFTPKGIGQSRGLELIKDYDITLADGSTVKILGKDQTLAKVDCNGFAGYDLKGKYIFSRNTIIPADGSQGKVTVDFTGTGANFSDFIVDLKKLPAFQLPTVKDYIFTLTNGKFDYSTTSNPANIKFPNVYSDVKDNTWRGLSFEKTTVQLPNQWNFGSSSVLKISNGETVIAKDGLYTNLSDDNILSLNQGKIKDWQISIDKIDLAFSESKLDKSDLLGKIKISVLDDPFTYGGKMTTNNNGDIDIEIKPDGTKGKLGLWKGEIQFTKDALVKVITRNVSGKKQFFPSADLHGGFTLNIDSTVFTKNVIGNAGSKVNRLKQALKYAGKPSLSIKGLDLKGFMVDPSTSVSKRFTLKDYQASVLANNITVGNKEYEPNSVKILYQPKTNADPAKLGFEVLVQEGINVVAITVWGKQENNGQFVFSHIDLDTRLVDCDCVSNGSDKYKSYGSKIDWDDEALIASNYDGAEGVNVAEFFRTKADKFQIKDRGGKKYVVIPYLNNIELEVAADANGHLIAQGEPMNQQEIKDIKSDTLGSAHSLDLSNYKINDALLGELVGHTSKSGVNKLPIDIKPWIKQFLGKYNETKYKFPDKYHLILAGLTVDKSLEAASARIIFMGKRDSTWLTFANGDVILKPKEVGFSVLPLYLTEDIKDVDPQFPMTFKKVLKNEPTEGSFAAIRCEGFEKFNIQSVYTTSGLQQAKTNIANAVEIIGTSAEIPFIIRGRDLIDFIAPINTTTARPFVLKGDGGKLFTIKKGFVDCDSKNNPIGHPSNKKSDKGVFLAEADMMIWGFMKKEGSNRVPLRIPAKNLEYKHGTGLTGVIKQDNPVPVASKSDMDGWNYTLEKVDFELTGKSFGKQKVFGKIELPIVKDGEFMGFSGSTGWDATKKIPTAVFNVDLNSKQYFNMPFLPGVQLYTDGGSEVRFTFASGSTRSEFAPNAKLTGKMGVLLTPNNPAFKDLTPEIIKKLPLELALGLEFTDMKINHPDDINSKKGCVDSKGVVGGIKTFSVATFGVASSNVFGNDPIKDNPRFQALKDKSTGVLEGFPISISGVSFKCQQHKTGQGAAAKYEDMFKLEFTISVNLMPGEDESDVDASTSEDKNKIDDDDDPIADIAGLFGDDSNSGGSNNNAAPAGGGKKSRTAGIAAAGQFGIWFKPKITTDPKTKKKTQDLEFDHVNLDALAIDGKFSILTIKGSLLAYIDDPKYGDGFKGYVKIDITSGGSGGGKSGAAKGFQIQGMTQFGTAAFDYGNGSPNPTKYKDKPYRYFFVDIEAIMKQGVGGKVALHGLGGGFFFNMARENSKTLEDERAKAFDRKVAADKRAAANKKLKPIVPPKPTLPDDIDYNNPAFTGVDSVAFTPGATFSGYKYFPQKGVYGGYIKGIFSVMKRPDLAAFDIALGLELKKNNKGSLGLSKIFAKGDLYMQGDADITLRKDAPGQGTIDITYDHVNKALTCDFGFNFEIIQTTQKITMSGTGGMYFGFGANKKWYVKIGKPQLADRITSAFAFGAAGEYIELGATRAYLQFGHDLDNLPRLSEVIPGWPASLDNQDKTRPDLSGGDGLVFGINYQLAQINKKFLMFNARLNAGGGFDVSLKKYSPAPDCAGTGKLGIDGWYAKGQAYMYLSAGVDIDVDLWFYKGSVNIFDAMAAIALQAQLPNPTWLRGVFYGRYSVLGGALEGDLNFQFELGKKCKINPGTDFLNKVDMITALLPENNEKKFPIFSDLGAGFAVPINRQFLVETMDVNQNDIIRRFMPFVKKVELKKASGEKVDGKLELSQTGYEMTFRPYNILKDTTNYVFTVEMGWKELENNKWVVVPQGEIKTAKFKTGPRPDRIYKGMIATMTPGENQRYWHKNYGTAQMIFKGSYGYLFPSSSTDLKGTSELTKNMTNNGKDIPNNVPLEYFVEAKEYNKYGKETQTIRIPIYSNHDEDYTLWEERIKSHNNLEVGIPYLVSIPRKGRRLVFDKLNTIDFCKGCMVSLTIKREPARSYIAIKSASNLQNQVTRKDTVQKQEIINGVVTTKSETKTTTVQKKITTLSNNHVKGLGELYATYYTAYFGVSEFNSLKEKVGPYERKTTEVGKGNLPNYYEFPYNYNLPRSTWLKDIKARPAYYVVDTKEPLDKYDLARLRANTKREDRTADQVDFYTKTYERLKREGGGRYSSFLKGYMDWSYKTPSKAKFRLNWSKMHSSSTAGGTIQDFLSRNTYRDQRQKVLMQNFYKYVMQEYYKVDGWSSKIVANKNLKLEITPTERGAKRLDNNFTGGFEGLSGYQGSHSFGFMILDDYILNLQGKAAQIIAEDIYAKRGKWQTVQERIGFFGNGPSRTVHRSPSGWTWKIWDNNYENLQYFLKSDNGAKRDFKDPYQYRNSYESRHYKARYGYHGGVNDYFYYTYIGSRQWKYMLEQVSAQVRQRSSGISFRSSSDKSRYIKYPKKNISNTPITFWNGGGAIDIGYDRNSTFIRGLGVTSGSQIPLFAWNKDLAEAYTFRYNDKKELTGLDTKYGVIELGSRQNIYGSFNKFKGLDIKLLTDNYPFIKKDYKVNSGRITLKEDYYGRRERINAPIIRYDFDYGKSELLVGYTHGRGRFTSPTITIYEVNNGEEDKRVGTFDPRYLGYDYRPTKIGLTPGKTYHIYQRGYGNYSNKDNIWYKLDDTFWKTNNGKFRAPYGEPLPDDVFSRCKTSNVSVEAGSDFAFRFTPKTKEAQAGESPSSWQSSKHIEIGKWTSSSSDFTIEVRVKPEKGNATILDFTRGNTFKIENGKVVASIRGVGKFESKSTLTVDKWYHLAVVYQKSSQEVRFYINSILDKVEKANGNRYGSSGNVYLEGKGAMVLDDIAIWKTARTRQQLIASATSPQPIIERDLLLRYDFGSGISERTLLDLSRNRLHGVIKGGDCYCDYEKSSYTKDAPVSASMSYDYVLDFDGDEYVDVPNINLQNGAFTTEGWIKVKANSKDVAFIGLGDTKLQIKPVSAFNNKFKLGFTAKLQDNSTKTITSTDFLQLDKWHYIALVQDAFTGGKTNIRILIDGVQSGQLKAVSPIKINSNLRLGGDGTTNANVVMDEWRVWSIPRKISDIAYVVRNGLAANTDLSNQLVHYDFDRGGPGKAELTDNTRHLKHGTLTQMEANEDWILSDRTKVPSLTGDFAMRFDGNKDFVKIPHQPKLNIGNNFTFEFWAKSKTTSSGQTWLIRKQNSYGVYFMDNNALGLSTWGEDAGFGVNTYIIDDKWHHYTITGESGKEAILYIDGVVVKKVSGNFSPNQGGDDVYLGGVPNGKNANVMVENVMVWNRTLSLAEVRKHAVKPTTETKDLVLHFNFDAGRGKTALGRSSNRINGVLSTDMKDDDWIPLKETLVGDRAIDFDGKDDYLKGKSKTTFTGDLNIEAWINVDKLHEYRPYFAQIAGIVDTAGTATLRLAKVNNQWRLQGAVTLQDGSQVFVNDPTPIVVKKWYKVKLFVERNTVQLFVNDKEVAKQTINSQVKAEGIICIGGNKHLSFFDGIIDDVRINGEHFAFDEFRTGSFKGDKGTTLDTVRMDIDRMAVPDNQFKGQAALVYPNPETNRTVTNDKLVYSPHWDATYKGRLGFSIAALETIEEIRINDNKTKLPVIFWIKDKPVIRYSYKTVQGKSTLDKIDKSATFSALYRGDFLPISLPYGMYDVEIKVNGKWYKTTHEVAKAAKLTKF